MPTDKRPKKADRKASTSKPATKPADRTYDAIVIGAGHNGMVNGAYLAKAGLKTLILERRPNVGGAAITEELVPGFWFTTFSYALSLLRPEIIHDLELTKHGFMPLLMSSSFAPTEDGDYLWLGQDHGENLKEIARHSKHDADAYNQYSPRHGDGLPGAQAADGLGPAGPVQRRPGRAAGARRARVPGSGAWTSGRSTTRSGC